MENILIGIIKSSHSVKLKQNLIEKIIFTNKVDKSKLYVYLKCLQDYCLTDGGIIDLTSDAYIFQYNSNDKSVSLHEQLTSKMHIIRYSIEFFIRTCGTQTEDFFHDDLLMDLNLSKLTDLFNLVLWFGLLVQLGLIRNTMGLYSHVSKLLIATKLCNYNMPLCVVYVGLIEQHHHIIFSSQNENLLVDLKLCVEMLINLLAKYRTRKNEIDPKYSIEYFKFYFSLIVKLLVKLMNWNEYLFKTTILSLLNVLKHDSSLIVSMDDCPIGLETSGSYKKNDTTAELTAKSHINMCLAHLFKSLDMNKTNEFLKYLLLNKYFTSDTEVKHVLSNLIDFLAWSPYESMDLWCIGFMTLLALINKYYVIIEISELKIDYLLDLILCESANACKQAINVISFFLINYQHSPKLFLKSGEKLKNILGKCLVQLDSASFKQISIVCLINMNLFNGYPEVYKPLLDLIKIEMNDSIKDEIDHIRSKFMLNSFQKYSNLDHDSNKNDWNFTNSSAAKLKDYDCGLVNLGNTCYLNCIIQALYSCKKFLLGLFSTNLNLNLSPDPSSPNQLFMYNLELLFSQIFLTKRVSIKTIKFHTNCIPPWFQHGQQQDSSEYLIYLLDSLNEELKANFQSSLVEDSFVEPSQKTQKIQKPKPMLKTLYKCLLDTNISQTIFVFIRKGLKIQTECICSNCMTRTERIDTSFMLPLSFTNANEDSIQLLLENYFKSEDLNESNGNLYSCQNCRSMQNARKNLKITRQNDYLILTLNRFFYSATSNEHRKITNQLVYNQTIEVDLKDSSRSSYELIACVVHSGSSLHHGHYYAYINQAPLMTETWLLANDEKLTRISFKELNENLSQFKHDTPYILFYRNSNTVGPVNVVDIEQKIPNFFKSLISTDNRIYLNETKTSKTPSANIDRNYYPRSIFKKDDDEDDTTNEPETSQFDGPRFVF